jgi:glycerol kinase
MSRAILAIDQGTTSSRSIIFDQDMSIKGIGQQEFEQYFPASGWVEHDADEIWKSVLATVDAALSDAGLAANEIAAIGISNQRETIVAWDRESGRPLHRAIVWQDRRTSARCAELKAAGHEDMISEKTGLLIDPYFSATKIGWLLENVEGLRAKAEAGTVCFGTVDSWLIFKLTGGKRHVTDATNASRTMLFNIQTQDWDDDLLGLFGVPRSALPDVLDSADDFGVTALPEIDAELPILGVAGDQQAATIGNACFEPGMLKSTYGTGCFAVLNTGCERLHSKNRLLTTIAYRLDGEVTYALEGSIFIAGAAVQWLRDGLGLIETAEQSNALAAKADPEQQVYLVPAFTGLGAPYWDADARGALFGLTRNTGPAEFAKAALDSVAYQTFDLLDAMARDGAGQTGEAVVRVDGGMVASDYTMQRLADILGRRVDRPVIHETTALGAAWLAGSRAGLWPDRQGFAAKWALDRTFVPSLDEADRQAAIAGWRDAVRRTLSDASPAS